MARVLALILLLMTSQASFAIDCLPDTSPVSPGLDPDVNAAAEKVLRDESPFCKSYRELISGVIDACMYCEDLTEDTLVKKSQRLSQLNRDEYCAVLTYTDTGFHQINDAFASQKPNLKKTAKPFLKVFLDALNKMPSFHGTVKSGHYFDVGVSARYANYPKGKVFSFPWFLSSSKLVPFAGNIQMVIQSRNGKDISALNPREQEVLFSPHARFKITAKENMPNPDYERRKFAFEKATADKVSKARVDSLKNALSETPPTITTLYVTEIDP